MPWPLWMCPPVRCAGLIPTGWGPTRVALSPDEKTLYVTSARGYGAGPNGGRGFVKPPQGTYIGDIQLGTFQTVPIPDAAQLATYTKQVLANTYQSVSLTDDGQNPLPVLPKTRQSAHQTHCVHHERKPDVRRSAGATEDGQWAIRHWPGLGLALPLKAGLRPTAAAGGRTTDRAEDSIRITAADVMPNHQRVARQFAFSDNFYCDSDASIHGHHWMMGTIPNEWVEANAASAGRFDADSKAPGRRFPKTIGRHRPGRLQRDWRLVGSLRAQQNIAV